MYRPSTSFEQEWGLGVKVEGVGGGELERGKGEWSGEEGGRETEGG